MFIEKKKYELNIGERQGMSFDEMTTSCHFYVNATKCFPLTKEKSMNKRYYQS